MKDHLNVLIADDHSLVRDGLKIALSRLPELHNIYEAGNADEVHQQLAGYPDINLVILDLQMPGVDDLDLLSGLCNTCPDLPIVVLSAAESRHTMHRAIEHGAAGFIPKRTANSVLISALQLILAGGVYIPTEMFDETETAANGNAGNNSNRWAAATSQGDFTERQLDVIRLLVSGKTNKAIARELGLSEHTVKIHLSAIYRTLGVINRTEAVIACRERGMFNLAQKHNN